jgi:hypothetical protein
VQSVLQISAFEFARCDFLLIPRSQTFYFRLDLPRGSRKALTVTGQTIATSGGHERLGVSHARDLEALVAVSLHSFRSEFYEL